MSTRPGDRGRHGGLLLWVIFSSGLTIRDVWLAAHRGGVTPCWLLRAETAAFALSAISGTAVLNAPDRADSTALKTATAAGFAAVVIHGVRLTIYLRARGTKPG